VKLASCAGARDAESTRSVPFNCPSAYAVGFSFGQFVSSTGPSGLARVPCPYVTGPVGHTFLVGLPIAISVRHFSSPSSFHVGRVGLGSRARACCCSDVLAAFLKRGRSQKKWVVEKAAGLLSLNLMRGTSTVMASVFRSLAAAN
jgi:hypothetical protein